MLAFDPRVVAASGVVAPVAVATRPAEPLVARSAAIAARS